MSAYPLLAAIFQLHRDVLFYCNGYRPARNIIETLNTLHLTLYINQTINQMMFNNNQSINQLQIVGMYFY
jgi:hypothetical protein